MKTLFAVAACLALSIGCQPAAPLPTGSPDDLGVTLTHATPERLTGAYVDGAGHALDFDMARSGDTLYLNLATKAGRELVHAETVGDTYVFRYLGGRLTLSVDKSWVEAVRAQGDDGPASQDETQMHWTGDMNVLDEMLSVPEMSALPWLSRSLGELGYTGSAYPASLAMHKMAKQSADALGIELPPLAQAAEDGTYCSRPTANDCYGMCGNGCNCWSWVCGDCCYHHGCAVHDSWCRNGQWYYCYNITAVVALFGC